jgi:MoaA/NifB/PqqE/SkfB family radical SAM enzyme
VSVLSLPSWREAVSEGTVGGRLWFYSNYHCNLACCYCLTESKPDAPRRILAEERVLDAAGEAVSLGFTGFGVTGGEPFLLPAMPKALALLAQRLPTVVLTNGTLFSRRLLDALRPLRTLPLSIQISLDSGDERANDSRRATGNFAKVVEAICNLKSIGMHVRIGSTVDDGAPEGLDGLCDLHRALGISEDDHVVRPILQRGRAARNALGVTATFADLPPELTLTAEGAYWSPAAPTVTGDRLDDDYLLTRTIAPLAIPVGAMLQMAKERGAEATGRVK